MSPVQRPTGPGRQPRRRDLLRAVANGTALVGLGFATSGCSDPTPPQPGTGPAASNPEAESVTTPTTGGTTRADQGRTLLAYYSRAGENYYYGGRRQLEVGNTEALTELLRGRIACDVYRIDAADPYPVGYDETVARNVAEQNTDARPGLAGTPPSLDAYSTILLASPLWNVQPPMIMRTLTDRYDFTGKTVHPVVTYAVSGLGRAPAFYEQACRGARIATGLAVRGEEVGSSGPDVERWLQSVNLPTR